MSRLLANSLHHRSPGRSGWWSALRAAMVLSLILSHEGLAQLNVRPEQTKGLSVVEKLGQSVPLDIPFLDPEGQVVTLGNYFHDGNKPVLLAMVYFRCPLLCPLVISNLEQKLNEVALTLGEKYNLVLVSFDPTEGPSEAMKQREGILAGYSKDLPKNVREKFAVLTGSASSSQRLADALGFPYKYLPESAEYSHGTVIFTLTPDGKISRYIYGVNYSPETLRMALLEASDGKIGTVVDRAIMWCFQYHPGSNGYALDAMRLMKVGGVVITMGVSGLLCRMFLIEKRRRRVVFPSVPPAGAPVDALSVTPVR